jgi:hypothetical protein
MGSSKLTGGLVVERFFPLGVLARRREVGGFKYPRWPR